MKIINEIEHKIHIYYNKLQKVIKEKMNIYHHNKIKNNKAKLELLFKKFNEHRFKYLKEEVLRDMLQSILIFIYLILLVFWSLPTYKFKKINIKTVVQQVRKDIIHHVKNKSTEVLSGLMIVSSRCKSTGSLVVKTVDEVSTSVVNYSHSVSHLLLYPDV
jgi:hypothetical protein